MAPGQTARVHLADGTYQHLREALPGIAVVQVIHVGGALVMWVGRRAKNQSSCSTWLGGGELRWRVDLIKKADVCVDVLKDYESERSEGALSRFQ